MKLELIFGLAILLLILPSVYSVTWTAGTGTFTAGLNKSMYVPGEQIVVSGCGSGGQCSNGWQYLTMTANGSTIFKREGQGWYSPCGSTSFTAGTSNGCIWTVGCAWGSTNHSSPDFKVKCNGVNLCYTVNSPPSIDNITLDTALFNSIQKIFNQNYFQGNDEVVCSVTVSDREGDPMVLTTNLCYSVSGGTETCVDSQSMTVNPGVYQFTLNVGEKLPVGSRVYCTASAVGSNHPPKSRKTYSGVTSESWSPAGITSVISETTNIFNDIWNSFN